ncbi:MAG: hypothetical protein CMF52_05880 [Legionellales bacterium]|nr:hypothetical protein [Legionellales bacterium]
MRKRACGANFVLCQIIILEQRYFYVEFDTWQEYAYCNPGEYPYGWHNEDPGGADLLSYSGHL